MVNLIRRFQQPLLIALTIIVIIAFVVLFNMPKGQVDRVGSTAVGTVYGRSISQMEFRRVLHKFELCRDLQLIELMESLAGREAVFAMFMGRGSMDRPAENFVWNNMVLRHEADRLGINPTVSEVDVAVKTMPPFQTNGAFDSAKFNQFVALALAPRGMTGDQLEDLVRDDLRLKKLKALLGTTLAAGPDEIRSAFEQRNQKTEASVIRLRLDDFKTAAQPTDDDVKKLYEERKASLKSDEQRKVKFAAFALEKTDKPLEGKQRVEAMQALATKADEFATAMTEKDAKFDEVAAKTGAKIGETPAFPADDAPDELGKSEQAAQAAFALTKAQPNSDAITTDNGYYVVQLAEVIESHPLTLDEAKANLGEQLKNERATEALNLKGADLRTKIEADVKAGKSFADAAQAAGVKVEPFPAFSQAEPKLDAPDAREVMSAAAEIGEGQTGTFTPTSYGGMIVHVDKRQPVEEAAFEKQKAMLTDNVARMKREALFAEWLKGRRADAKVQMAHG